MSRHRLRPLHRLRRRVARSLEANVAAGGWVGRGALQILEWLALFPAFGTYFHHAAGILHTTAGHHDQAIVHQEKALDRVLAGGRSIHRGAIHYRLGEAQLRIGELAAAEASFRTAVTLASNPRVEWLALVDTMSLQGRRLEAVDELLRAAGAIPAESPSMPVPLPWYLITPALATEERVRTLRRVVERHPTASEAMILLSLMENSLGRYEDGTVWLQRAAALRWPASTAAAGDGKNGSRARLSCESKLPSFLIIGQAKAATTTLFEALCTHPSIDPPLIKEPLFWSDRFAWGESWYRAVFPPQFHRPGTMTCEASVTSLTHPESARRLAAAMPGIKLIAVLREPVSRAYSDYHMEARMGLEQRPWDAIVDAEIESLHACPLDVAELERVESGGSYLLRSAALPHLQRWLAHFRRDQLLILRQRQLADDLPATLRRVCKFLGLPADVAFPSMQMNKGQYLPMSASAEQRLRAWFAPHERALADFLSELGVAST